MATSRVNQTDEEREEKREEARSRMQKIRSQKPNEDTDYENMLNRNLMRKVRKEQSGKKHVSGNLKPKQGMKLLNEEGRLNEFASRYERRKKPYKTDDLHELRNYWEKSDEHQQKLNKLQPDIVERINEQIRIEKEEKRNSNKELTKEEVNWWMDDDNE